MHAILPGLYTFSGLIMGRVYAIEDGDGLTLVDAGLALAADRVVKQLRVGGRQASAVRRILITHAHPDHVGGLARLQQMTGAQVMTSAAERPVVEGRAAIARPAGRRLAPAVHFSGAPVARELSDGEVVAEVMGGLQTLHTPGHAPGHLAFWQPERRILFCGDVIFHLSKLGLPFSFLTYDVQENIRSVQRLAALEPEVVCFGHGPVLHRAAGAVRAFAERLGNI